MPRLIFLHSILYILHYVQIVVDTSGFTLEWLCLNEVTEEIVTPGVRTKTDEILDDGPICGS